MSTTIERDGVTVEALTIYELMGRVMAAVGPIAKGERNTQQNFNFRGIDSVVNVVGPVLRDHGVIMVPEAGEPTVDHYTSKGGANMTHVLLPVTFHFYGPAGDSLSCHVIGEASDAGDKVMSKAHAVAWRVAMLEVFAIPTDDPDPDAASHERAPEPTAEELAEQACIAKGWASKAEHDEAFAINKAEAAKLSDESKATLKKWWDSEGLKLPISEDHMYQYERRIDEAKALEAVG